MRALIRVVSLSLLLLVTPTLVFAAPRDQRDSGRRGEPKIVKIAKRIAAGIRSLGDSLTVPIP